MKKVLALFLALMMVLSLFTACAKQETTTTAEPNPAETETEAEQTTEEAPAASGEDIVINFLGAQYSDKTEPYLKQVCADFEAANPGIKVNLEIVGWDNISSRATALVGAGQAPDIYNGGSASEYVPDGLLYNVKDIVSEELQADFYPSFLDNNRDIDDGEVYAVPYLASVRALYCNAKIFKEVGIENPPKTWTEVEEACQKINDFYNGDVYAWGIDATTTEGQTMVAYYGWSNGGGYVDDDFNYTINCDANVEGYYKWISEDDDSHFIYVNFKENESGVYTVSAYNTSGFSGTEAIEKYLDIVKAEAAEANKAASANAEMKDFSVEIAQFAKDDVKVKIMTKIPVSGWSFDDSGRCLVENDDPTAFGAGAIQFEVRENVEKFDSSKDSFENYQDIEDRVIGGITFRGRTYKYIGYEWIQYIAQLDDNRALSIGLRNMDCVPGTMPDIILNNMTFQ